MSTIQTEAMLLNTLKNVIVPEVAARVPFNLFQRVTGLLPLIPYYHFVRDDKPAHMKHLYEFKNVRQFESDLDAFLKLYRPIELGELLSCMKSGRPVPRNSLLLSFDDGFSEQYDVIVPILWAKGIPATFFLTMSCLDNKDMLVENKVSLVIEHTVRRHDAVGRGRLQAALAGFGIQTATPEMTLLSFGYADRDVVDAIARNVGCDVASYLRDVEPYLTSEHVQRMIGMGFTIGAHSVDHPMYSRISCDEQVNQTLTSVKFIRQRFSLNYGAFAFPNGDDHVTPQFFEKVVVSGGVDVSFGNIGLRQKFHSCHFGSRLPMEKTGEVATKVIARYYAKSLYDLAMRRPLQGTAADTAMPRSELEDS